MNQSYLVETGSIPAYACLYDQRFSYYTYIPKCYGEDPNRVHPLAVIIHGNERAAQSYRSAFKDYAEDTGTIILAPLFPAGIIEPHDKENYKFIKFHDLRFDRILLSMIDELAKRYKISTEKFLLHGFSGGGQFVHRFLYLHPDRLQGVSIGAPGRFTFLDENLNWPFGIGNTEEVLELTVQLELIQQVPVQLVVGKEDLALPVFNPKFDRPIEGAGNTRIDRVRMFRDHLVSKGISVRYDEVAEVAHEGMKILPVVKEFFKRA
ncbi:hypothetical protein [Ammoniphilus resinae]|uniref:Peptidase n=1 Tax=Ammoniphilus resinae TaxID=861532 RepID=A0ABS4GMR7_9BACL|nr:hypothetical protein [Ammoniphilus resinae]MBP1931407.1 putative peptidase [Ammoniphilus resinae]